MTTRAHIWEARIYPLPESDGGSFAEIAPELPGCRPDSDTPQEALTIIYDAITCWMEAAAVEIPQPRRIAA